MYELKSYTKQYQEIDPRALLARSLVTCAKTAIEIAYEDVVNGDHGTDWMGTRLFEPTDPPAAPTCVSTSTNLKNLLDIHNNYPALGAYISFPIYRDVKTDDLYRSVCNAECSKVYPWMRFWCLKPIHNIRPDELHPNERDAIINMLGKEPLRGADGKLARADTMPWGDYHIYIPDLDLVASHHIESRLHPKQYREAFSQEVIQCMEKLPETFGVDFQRLPATGTVVASCATRSLADTTDTEFDRIDRLEYVSHLARRMVTAHKIGNGIAEIKKHFEYAVTIEGETVDVSKKTGLVVDTMEMDAQDYRMAIMRDAGFLPVAIRVDYPTRAYVEQIVNWYVPGGSEFHPNLMWPPAETQMIELRRGMSPPHGMRTSPTIHPLDDSRFGNGDYTRHRRDVRNGNIGRAVSGRGRQKKGGRTTDRNL